MRARSRNTPARDERDEHDQEADLEAGAGRRRDDGVGVGADRGLLGDEAGDEVGDRAEQQRRERLGERAQERARALRPPPQARTA